MAKKFDTNPLDPEFPEKVREPDVELKTAALPNTNVHTERLDTPFETEEQTRKFGESEFADMNATFGNGSNPPATFKPQALYDAEKEETKSHNIGSISLPENILMALSYVPFAYIGVIAAIIQLIFIPKSEPKVRYHAAQGLAAHIGVFIVITILGIVSIGTDIAETVSWIFELITSIMLLIFAVKAFQGKPIHIETVQDLTDWLEEKIAPSK